MSNWRLYIAGSIAATVGVVAHSYNIHHQFYPTCVHLMSSKLSRVVRNTTQNKKIFITIQFYLNANL